MSSKPGPIHLDEIPEGPPEEEFWERYNKRLEFPLSTVTAILVHVVVAAVLIFMLHKLMNSDNDRSGVPLKLVPEMGGLDDDGSGMAGSGGQDSLKDNHTNAFEEQLKVLPKPEDLPIVKQDIKDALNRDDAGDTPISDYNVAPYAALDKSLQEKFLGIGAKQGAGPGVGKGDDNTKGAGPGGTGANSSRARSLRWVMRFRTASGDDYVEQLAAMGAEVLVPLPPENKDCLYFPNLKNPSDRRMASDADTRRLAGRIKFSDSRPDSVAAVCSVLGVKERARSFWAFFPKGFEDELAQKEIGYRNRRPEVIEETIFRVIIRNGKPEIIVDDQVYKR